jgi:DNA-directed RNA polymerases I and III subunit RPAC1
LFDDILIAKLRPGQEIEMELICEKGIGKTHAKWSPVSTAYYRLVPDITITKDITGDDAEELKKLCPTGVYDIEDLGGKKGSKDLSD